MTTAETPNTGPLKSDLRLIEMGTLLAGPFCGQLMGDFGAEVIKVEPPGIGRPDACLGPGKSAWHVAVVAGRRPQQEIRHAEPARGSEGQAMARDLIAKADFLLENFRPGTMERWNLSYDELKKINPGLIMIRVSGFGQTGPYSKARRVWRRR